MTTPPPYDDLSPAQTPADAHGVMDGGGGAAGGPMDLEIKDAQIIFNAAWAELEADVGRSCMRFPREIILLGGAPGSGKGTNTEFIMELRDLTCRPIVISELLDSPQAKRIKDAGGMVGDREVIAILLRKLLEPEYVNGALVDGFPRTKVQVECLKLLFERMNQLRREFDGTAHAVHFRKPIFHIVVLFVDEAESIARQLKRGREIRAHNEEVERTGVGDVHELRPTDLSEELARNRYRTFKEKTWAALRSLRRIFHYHFINAMGPLAEVQENIVKEFAYQSSLELDPRTYETVRVLPLAEEIVQHARQELVRRLDSYEFEQPELLRQVVDFIRRKMMPIIMRHAISGQANVNSEDPLLDSPVALAMLIDVLSERGFHAVVDIHRLEMPERFDPATGRIECRTKKVFRIQVRFEGSEIRRG